MNLNRSELIVFAVFIIVFGVTLFYAVKENV